jgi:xylulokinase
MTDVLLGIDLGSTSLKAVLYDLDGHPVAKGSRPTEKFHPDEEHPEWVVWQPEQIWGSTAAAVRDAVAALDDPRRIRAVAVTGMGMDGLPIDEQGHWLYPMISWHDPRTTEQLAWWEEHIGAPRVFSVGGNPLWHINSALRILWVREHEPEVYARADKWLLIEDFLNYMLCGRCVTDYSMASCTLLFDQRTRSWSDEMLAAAGIERRLLCEALPSGTPIGEVTRAAAEKTGLPEGTPVILGGHDHLCGALPVGAFEPGVVLDVTGTWESVIAATKQPILDDQLRTMGMTVQAHVSRDRWAVWGGTVAADMLEWYRRELGGLAEQQAAEDGEVVWDKLMAMAAAAPAGARGVMFLPHFSGATCPQVDGDSRGAFVGLANTVTQGDLLRAMVEGLNYQFLDIIRSLQTGLNTTVERIVGVGGGTRNQLWMQNKADVVGRAIEVPEVEEATPHGAAILAGIGAGLYQDEQEAFERVYRAGKTYEPNREATALYQARFAVYQQLYPALRDIHGQLET